MDVGAIASALALSVASGLAPGACKALWERVKGKVMREKPDAAAILEDFEQSPEQMTEPLRRLLRDLRATEDQKIVELANNVLQEARIAQTARAKYAVQAGRDIGSVYQADIIHINRTADDVAGRHVAPDPGYTTREPRVIKEILRSNFETIDQRLQGKEHIAGVATGFTDLDLLTSGWQAGDMIIVAARPAMGKTTWATCVARHAAMIQRIPVVIFSLAMNSDQLTHQILCSEARVDKTRLQALLLADEDWRKLARAMGPLSEAPIFIDDSILSAMDILEKARKLKAEHGLGLIVVDSIQLIQARSHAENRAQEQSEIARILKFVAKELEVPMIAISQLSGTVERLGSRRPMLSHLGESGDLADVVVFLYREDYYDFEKAQREGKENICEVIIAKNHHGPIGTVELYFHAAFGLFANIDRTL